MPRDFAQTKEWLNTLLALSTRLPKRTALSVPSPPGAIAVAMMVTGSVFTGLIFVVLGPILPLLATHFGDRPDGAALAQWTMTAPSLGLVLGGLVGGSLFDRFGPRVMMPPAFLVYGVVGASGVWIDSTMLMLASRFVMGFCACVLALGTTVMIAGAFDEVRRAKMLGYKNAVASGAGIGGALLAGAVAAEFGWRAAFAIYAVAILFVIPAVITTRHIPIAPAIMASPLGRWKSASASWPIYVATVCFGVVMMAPLAQVPFLMSEIGIADPNRLARILSCMSIGSIGGAFAYGHIVGRLGPLGTFLATMAIWATAMALLGTASSGWQAALGCLVSGMAGGLFMVHMANMLVMRASPADRGHAVGLLYVALFTGDFLNPMVLIPLGEAITRQGAFLALSAFCVAALLLGALLGRRRPRALRPQELGL